MKSPCRKAILKFMESMNQKKNKSPKRFAKWTKRFGVAAFLFFLDQRSSLADRSRGDLISPGNLINLEQESRRSSGNVYFFILPILTIAVDARDLRFGFFFDNFLVSSSKSDFRSVFLIILKANDVARFKKFASFARVKRTSDRSGRRYFSSAIVTQS